MKFYPRWLITIIAVALAILTIGGIWFYQAQEQALREEVERDLQTIADLKVGQISAWRQERLGDASLMMQSPFYREAVPRWFDSTDSELESLLLERFKAQVTSYGYANVLLVDAGGQIRLSQTDIQGTLHEEALLPLADALQQGRPLFTNLHVDDKSTPHLGIIAPFYGLDGDRSKPAGAVILQSDPIQFLYPLILSWPTASETAETLLIRQDGDDVLFLNELRHETNTALNLRIPMTRADLPAVMAVQGKTGIVEGVDYRGVEVLADLEPIPDSPWFMVAKIDKSEALASWKQRSTLIVFLFLAIGFVIIAAGLFAWQRNVGNQYRRLIRAEQAYSQSEARYATTLMSIGDAVIATDAEGRVDLMNPSAEELTGWRNYDARGRPLEDVFQIVNEESREPVENPVSEVLRSGKTVKLANHTTLIAADGTECPIADSAAPIWDEAGEIAGVVLVFSDQTRQRAAQRELLREMKRAQQYLDVAGSMIVVLDTHEKVVLVNQRCCEILGYDEAEMLGTNWFDHYLPDQALADVHAIFARIMAGQLDMDEYTENHVVTRDGEERLIAWHNAILRDENGIIIGTLSSGEDITESRLLEDVLRESEESYRTVISSVNEGIILQDRSGDVLTWNRAAEEVFGISAGEVVRQNAVARPRSTIREDGTEFPPMEHPSMHTVQTGEPLKDIVMGVYHSVTDQLSWIRINTNPVYADGEEEPRAVAISFSDITELRQAEEELRKSESLLNEMSMMAKVGGWEMDFITRTAQWTRGTYDIVEIDYGGPVPGPDEHIDYYLPEYRPMIEEAMRRMIEEDAPLDFEAQLRTEKGNIIWCRALGQGIREGDRCVGAYGAFQDITERKEKEASERKLLERIEAGLRHGDLAWWEMELPSGNVTFDDAKAEMLGYPPSKFQTFSDFTDLVHPDDREIAMQAMREHLAGREKRYEVEYRIETHNGSYKWFRDIGGIADRDAGAGHTRIVGIVEDITERKRAEEELQYQTALLRLIMDSAPDLIFFKDVNSTYLGCNRAFEEFAGRSEEEQIGKTDFDFFAPEEAQLFRDMDIKMLESGKAQRNEEWITYPDGHRVLLDTLKTPFRTESGEILGLVGISRDITERKQAEMELEQQTALLRRIMDTAPDLIFLKDVEGRYMACNAAFQEYAGRPESEQIGKIDFDFFDVEIANLYREMDQKALQSGKMQRSEEPGSHADGRTVLLDTVKAPFYAPDGEMLGIVGISRDITERQQAEEERQKLQEQLTQAQKMEAVGRLAGGVAHDFNNMLQSILGYSSLALLDAEKGSDLHENLSEIQKAGKRSADLTRQLLAFARRQTVSPQVLDLNDTVAGMLKMLRRLIGEDIDLAWMPGANVWNTLIDPSQVDQILANLIVNARDAIDGTGRISIETENFVCDQEYCSEHPEFQAGHFVVLAVSDDGTGMDAATMSNIFDPFFTTKAQGEGTGLGLATVYGIVKQNEGFINVYSEPQVGTTFKIYLRRHVGETDKVVEATERRRAAGGSETVLLVEDEAVILQLGERLLTDLGYTVLAANLPAEALRQAKEHAGKIDLLITDVVMPEMNGRDLADLVVTLYPDIKRLFMSGYTADVIAHRGVLDEGVEFMQKPFTINRLATKVREVLNS